MSRIYCGIESSKCLLPVNRRDKSVVWATFNKNVQKRNLYGLYKFNGEFDAVVTAVEVLQKLVSRVFAVKHGKSVNNISIPKGRVHSGTVNYPFFFKVTHKNVSQNRA